MGLWMHFIIVVRWMLDMSLLMQRQRLWIITSKVT